MNKISCVLRNGGDVKIAMTPNAGHPWFGYGTPQEWDILEIACREEAELKKLVAKAEAKHWQVWIMGRITTEPGAEPLPDAPFSAALFKPSGASAPWQELGPAYRKASE